MIDEYISVFVLHHNSLLRLAKYDRCLVSLTITTLPTALRHFNESVRSRFPARLKVARVCCLIHVSGLRVTLPPYKNHSLQICVNGRQIYAQ